MNIAQLFSDASQVDAVLFKVITKNDDSGRHGVVIPKEGYGMFPEFSGFEPGRPENYTESITTFWPQEHCEKNSKWKHYHRYPERRVTSLGCRKLNDAPPNTLIVFGRRGRGSCQYEVIVLYPSEPGYDTTLEAFGFHSADAVPGLFGVDLKWDSYKGLLPDSDALRTFLVLFDLISQIGFIESQRRGPTGVGYTFELLLGIAENNNMTGDFMGMEIKTYRSNELKMQDAEKMNLFLKEPKWIDSLSGAQRIGEYGYVDKNGRSALYSTVTINENSHGFSFRIDQAGERLYLLWRGVDVAYWTYTVLERRLQEKHTEAVFVAAAAKNRNAIEVFNYRTAVHCTNASADAFISLIGQGDAVLELRMHVKTNGSVRNHGSGFRIKKNRIPMLYGTAVQVRPIQ